MGLSEWPALQHEDSADNGGASLQAGATVHHHLMPLTHQSGDGGGGALQFLNRGRTMVFHWNAVQDHPVWPRGLGVPLGTEVDSTVDAFSRKMMSLAPVRAGPDPEARYYPNRVGALSEHRG